MRGSLAKKYGTLVSYSELCEGVTVADFLSHGEGEARFYWADGETILAGFGMAVNVRAWGNGRFSSIQQQAQDLFNGAVLETDFLARPRLFGGFAFRDDFAPDITWSAFHPAHFFLPHYQFTQKGSQTWLTINAHVEEGDPQAILTQLQEALSIRREVLQSTHVVTATPPPTVTKLAYPLSQGAWHTMLTQAIERMKEGELSKVVLSRVCEVWLAEDAPILSALAYLNMAYSQCIRFLFEPRAHHSFFGATPELLIGLNGRSLETMALAGSIQRGGDVVEDEQYAQMLLNSAKDRYEHELVAQALRQKLEPLSQQLEMSQTPQIYQLSNIQHLYTPVTATLNEPQTVFSLLEQLHPTPALGGTPRHIAMETIQQSEPVLRGWFASPVGWVDGEMNGRFAVAIRSAVAQKQRAWLYAGAGIVADSDPASEWAETELKFKPMKQALGVQ